MTAATPNGLPPHMSPPARLVLLGTAGGSPYWTNSDRAGIASAVVVGDRYYLVDAGREVVRQLRAAGLGDHESDTGGPLDALRAVFLTHLHSDHVVDLNNVLSAGLYNGLARADRPVPIFGPGNRGAVPPLFGDRPAPPVTAPANPTPGTAEMIDLMVADLRHGLQRPGVRRRVARPGRAVPRVRRAHPRPVRGGPRPGSASPDEPGAVPRGRPRPRLGHARPARADLPGAGVPVRHRHRIGRVLRRHRSEREPRRARPRRRRPGARSDRHRLGGPAPAATADAGAGGIVPASARRSHGGGAGGCRRLCRRGRHPRAVPPRTGQRAAGAVAPRPRGFPGRFVVGQDLAIVDIGPASR